MQPISMSASVVAPRERSWAARTSGRLAWVSALFPLSAVMGLVSHLGSEARRGPYSILSEQELQTTGTWALALWASLLCLVGLACWLEPLFRRRAKEVLVLSTALMASGIFWTVGATVLEALMAATRPGSLTAVGSLLGLVCWVRLAALGLRGAWGPRI